MERYLAARKLILDGWAARLARRYRREIEQISAHSGA
jgi:hypothetical protein